MKISPLVFQSRRSPVIGRGGMVASTQPLATAAGLTILENGGNAADAAVAVAAALNVTEPGMTGIGGDAFALFYEKKDRKVYALNGSGRAPSGLSLERLKKEGFREELPPKHPYTITVPGACAAWCDTVERFGCLSMADVLQPAIELAEKGFPVAPLTSVSWGKSAAGLCESLNGKELTLSGRGPQPGEIFRNPGLAKTFQSVAEGGKQAYYQGDIADGIIAIIKEAGGCMQLTDLANHQSTWEEPISVNYRGVRIWECPPNGQGLAALLALNLLKGFDLTELRALSPQRMHLLIEAMRIGFADARQYVADPVFSPAPLNELLSDAYAEERRKLIDLDRANPDVKYGTPPASSDTVYFSVVDAQGNACSFINSNYMGFGTGIVPRGWGFSLQNRGHNFSLDAQHPNALAPGKRPYHTIIPAMATYEDDQSLYASFGVMGGFNQPQGHMQVVVGMVDDELDPQSALDRPRFCIEIEGAGGKVAMEEGFEFQTLANLAEKGHIVRPVSGFVRGIVGRGQIIRRDPENDVLWAGSDPRADGCAMCLH
ncbi:MAG: gamma-glutamyltransferase [Anaerolineaceae bacterium]|nr:gamma-glutamyltransferase [Anaerolineaceae bacterium]